MSITRSNDNKIKNNKNYQYNKSLLSGMSLITAQLTKDKSPHYIIIGTHVLLYTNPTSRSTKNIHKRRDI